LTVFLSTPSIGQTKTYKLISKTQNADLNYLQLDNIDSFRKDSASLRQIFKPVKGKFIVYEFIATFKGESFDGTNKFFHDILVIKINDSSKIIDAYQYTLEWAEPPCQYDMYKNSVKNLVLTDNFKLDNLELTRTYFWDEKNKLLNDGGLVSLK